MPQKQTLDVKLYKLIACITMVRVGIKSWLVGSRKSLSHFLYSGNTPPFKITWDVINSSCYVAQVNIEYPTM